MTRKFRRGYFEQDITSNDWTISISNIIQNNDFGKWEDEDEDELKTFGGYSTKEEAIEDLKNMRIKELIDNDTDEIIWTKMDY